MGSFLLANAETGCTGKLQMLSLEKKLNLPFMNKCENPDIALAACGFLEQKIEALKCLTDAATDVRDNDAMQHFLTVLLWTNLCCRLSRGYDLMCPL